MNGRLERSALSGVLVREAVNFSSFWKSTTFSSTVQPTKGTSSIPHDGSRPKKIATIIGTQP